MADETEKKPDETDRSLATTVKVPIQGSLRVNAYAVLCDCVERGVQYGWNRAHKYCDDPTEQDITGQMADSVINEICEYFDFHDPQDDV